MSSDAAVEKLAAARAAVELVKPGMKLGLGTGSTAAEFVNLLGEKRAAGVEVTGVPTSEATAAQARAAGIELGDLDDLAPLDLTIDGADEIGPGLALIKGGGGALLREKIVARASRMMVVIADQSKCVKTLGAFPLPVEIVRFAPQTTMRALSQALNKVGVSANLRIRTDGSGAIFVTDEENFIVDCTCGHIEDPAAVARAISTVTGVVEHGLFVGVASQAIIGAADGTARTILNQ